MLILCLCNIRVRLTQLHLVCQVASGLLMAIGGAAIFVTKNRMQKDHFATVHSWAAIVTGLLFGLNVFQGLLLTFERKQNKTTNNWQWKDGTHRLVGALTHLGGAATVVLGIYSGGWGKKVLGEQLQMALSGLIVTGVVLLLGKSLFLSAKRPKAAQKTQ